MLTVGPLAVVMVVAGVKKVEHTTEEVHDGRLERARHFAAGLAAAVAEKDVAVAEVVVVVMENHVFSRQKSCPRYPLQRLMTTLASQS